MKSISGKQKLKTALIDVLGEAPMVGLHGLKFARAARQRRYAEPELNYLDKLVSRGDVAVDIGAAGSDWTIALARIVGNSGQVFAYEADPYYARVAQSTVRFCRFSNRCTIIHSAIGESEGTIDLAVADAQGVRGSGLQHVVTAQTRAENRWRTVSVPRVSLDSEMIRRPILAKTRLIKCDIEGYELFAVRGANNLLAQAAPIVILEIGHFDRYGYSNEQLAFEMAARHYLPFAMSKAGDLILTDRSLASAASDSPNRIFLHSTHHKNLLP